MQSAWVTIVVVVLAMMTCLVSPAGSTGLSAGVRAWGPPQPSDPIMQKISPTPSLALRGGKHDHDTSAIVMDDDKELPLLEGLLRQREMELRAKGERLTVMCVGESGTGKSSLISNIFTVPLGTAPPSTVKITETVCHPCGDDDLK